MVKTGIKSKINDLVHDWSRFCSSQSLVRTISEQMCQPFMHVPHCLWDRNASGTCSSRHCSIVLPTYPNARPGCSTHTVCAADVIIPPDFSLFAPCCHKTRPDCLSTSGHYKLVLGQARRTTSSTSEPPPPRNKARWRVIACTQDALQCAGSNMSNRGHPTSGQRWRGCTTSPLFILHIDNANNIQMQTEVCSSGKPHWHNVQ